MVTDLYRMSKVCTIQLNHGWPRPSYSLHHLQHLDTCFVPDSTLMASVNSYLTSTSWLVLVPYTLGTLEYSRFLQTSWSFLHGVVKFQYTSLASMALIPDCGKQSLSGFITGLDLYKYLNLNLHQIAQVHQVGFLKLAVPQQSLFIAQPTIPSTIGWLAIILACSLLTLPGMP